MKRRYIIAILVFISISFISCKDDQDDSSVDSSFNSWDINSNESNQFGNRSELHYKGGIIYLDEKGEESSGLIVQEITKQQKDIKYRAKRIPSSLYLQNKGLKGEELETALSEVSGEQLFYFEFEEVLKQDLVKKYFQENTDQTIAYLSFDIYNDFKLINAKGDTIDSDYSVYERNFHLAPCERILLSFSGIDPDEEVQLVYIDRLFGRGKFDFAFASTNYINNNIKNPS